MALAPVAGFPFAFLEALGNPNGTALDPVAYVGGPKVRGVRENGLALERLGALELVEPTLDIRPLMGVINSSPELVLLATGLPVRRSTRGSARVTSAKA
jgi:hypothetical protein